MNKEKPIMTFLEWYNWEYEENDKDLIVDSYHEIINEVYGLCHKDYAEAYYDLANIFEEYLKYLESERSK